MFVILATQESTVINFALVRVVLDARVVFVSVVLRDGEGSFVRDVGVLALMKKTAPDMELVTV